MYTIQERKKAIRLYIKYGLKAAPTIRELGYPSRKMLKRWYDDYKKNNKVFINTKRKSRYSKDQRKKAVNFYLTHGKNIAYTVRKLGYPSRSILSNWICEDVKNHQSGILKGKNIVQYTLEEKKNAALEAALRNESMNKISKKTQASSQSLYNWKRKYISDSLNEQIQKDKIKANCEIDSLKGEIAKLQKDIYQLRMEKDILEKAAELIKKDQGIDINALTNKEKAIIINALRNHYPLKTLLKIMSIMSISKSTYYYQQSVKDKWYFFLT